MKKLFVLIAVISLGFQSFAYDPVNEKLIESFKTYFPKAEQVNWQQLTSTFVVAFVEDGIRARAFFEKKDGNLRQLIRYYAEPQLPYAVLHAIQKQFKGKKIYGVTEVTTATAQKNMETEYFVKLEDGNSWTTVKVNTIGQAIVTQKFRKA